MFASGGHHLAIFVDVWWWSSSSVRHTPLPTADSAASNAKQRQSITPANSRQTVSQLKVGKH